MINSETYYQGVCQSFLGLKATTPTVIRWSAYIPPITLGLYKDRFDTRSLAARFSVFEAAERLPVRLDRIWLATYTPAVIGGPLAMEHQMALNGV